MADRDMTCPHLPASTDPVCVEAKLDHRIECLEEFFRESEDGLAWPSPFVLPGWIRAWRDTFAPDSEPWVVSVRESGRLIGVAALLREEDTVRFSAGPEVCDHMDIVCDPRQGEAFCAELLETLGRAGIRLIETGPVRPDSHVIRHLVPAARRRGFPVEILPDEAVHVLDLPDSWEAYLRLLSGKQRHEVRRKLRRLEERSTFQFRVAEAPEAVAGAIEVFLGLFRRNRTDKAVFMNAGMEGYFRSLAGGLPETRIGVLDVDGTPAAAVMCFDHRDARYLYNSGFDAAISHLSVGLLCKVLSIREAIARRLRTYDFLKGDEPYKRQLGGRPVALYRCRIDIAG